MKISSITHPILSLGLLILAACEQAPRRTLVLKAVLPEVVAAGQERFVVIEGANFTPVFTWSAEGGGVGVNNRFTVQFGTLPEVEAFAASPERLIAKFDGSLNAGLHPVTVRGPGGQNAVLQSAICVDDRPLKEVLHVCIEGNRVDLCASSWDGSVKRTLVADVVPGSSEGAGANQTAMLTQAYALSPDGKKLAFLRHLEAEGRLQMLVADLEEGWEVTLLQVEVLNEPQPLQLLSPPSFSPDARQITYVARRRQLTVQQVPNGPAEVPGPVFLVEEPEVQGQKVVLLYPEIDPASRYVLYTRIVDRDQASAEDDQVSLHLVSLHGGPPRELIAGNQPPARNGPGSFLPPGDRVLFVSDRLRLQIPTPFGFMAPATNLYTTDLFAGPVEPVTNPTAAYLYGKPVVPPDGRFAASTGFLSDVSGSGLDIILTDLQRGDVRRVIPDPVRFCVPENIDADCNGTMGEHTLACCQDPENIDTCCNFLRPSFCPTWDLGPSFGHDSRVLLANAIVYQWSCKQNQLKTMWRWELVPLNIFLYRGILTPEGQAGNVEYFPYGILDLPLAPLPRQVVSCPQQ